MGQEMMDRPLAMETQGQVQATTTKAMSSTLR